MKNKIFYIVAFVGFIIGVLFYLLNLVISNSEVSSINPQFSELLRNADYSILIVYGLISTVVLLVFTSMIKYIRTK